MGNFAHTLLVILAAALFSGCGQMGPLFMPAEEGRAAPVKETPAQEVPLESGPPQESGESTTENGGA